MIGDLICIGLYFVVGLIVSACMDYDINYDLEAVIFVTISWPIILILFISWLIEDFLGGNGGGHDYS
jgi:hypothetical protein